MSQNRPLHKITIIAVPSISHLSFHRHNDLNNPLVNSRLKNKTGLSPVGLIFLLASIISGVFF
jgi:hypothetical protein